MYQTLKAHAIADRNYEYEDQIVGVNMHCEYPNGHTTVALIWFPIEELPNLEAYFRSPKGMEPLEVRV